MRRTIGLAAALITTWLSAIAFPAAAEDVPQRKPGLWEITTIGAGTGTNTVRTCIGEEDKILTPANAGNCVAPSVKSGGADTTIVDVVCTSSEGKETISGAFTGNFDSRYRAQVKMTFDPPLNGMPPHWGVTVDGKYLGPDCSSAETPGEAK
jgi:Protein of unknown function (DUF3617)